MTTLQAIHGPRRKRLCYRKKKHAGVGSSSEGAKVKILVGAAEDRGDNWGERNILKSHDFFVTPNRRTTAGRKEADRPPSHGTYSFYRHSQRKNEEAKLLE